MIASAPQKPMWRLGLAYLLRALLATALMAACAWGGGRNISAPLGALMAVVSFGALLGMVRRSRLDVDEQNTAFRRYAVAVGGSVVMLLLAGAAASAVSGQWPQQTLIGRTAVFVFVAGWVFVALLQLIRLLLRLPWRPLAVARTVVDEALALRVVVAVIGLLFFVIAVMAFGFGETDLPVRYRVQAFLSWSQMAGFLMLAVMTVLVASWSLSAELRDKQIYHIAVKPIGRGSYLLGKWIGLAALDLMLVVVLGLAIYGFTIFYLADPTAAVSVNDRIALDKKVLVARTQIQPRVPEELQKLTDERLEKFIKDDPEFVEKMGGPKALREEIYRTAIMMWKSIGPLEQRRYDFEGLGEIGERWVEQRKAQNARIVEAKKRGEPMPRLRAAEQLQFRYKMRTSKRNDIPYFEEVTITPFVGGRPLPPPSYWNLQINRFEEEPIPAGYISKNDGVLRVRLWHRDPVPSRTIPVTINFSDIDLRYRVGDFEPNLARAMAVMWTKLIFLAMLGLVCAVFLSFPVATLSALVVFGICWLGPTLDEAVESFEIKSQNPFMVFLEWFIRTGGQVLTYVFQKFGAYAPSEDVVEGRYFSWTQLGACLFWIGVVWTGVVGLIGFLVIRSRELAKVQV